MSDAEKPNADAKSSKAADARASGSANVISIEQARAELLRRPRPRATPPKGVDRPVRSRSREAPPPVTMPPGEHSAVIVTDTPAARAHIDKKTVHPGEAPEHTHHKKVRVKTHLDPRRAVTQLTDRRPVPEGEVAAISEPDISNADEVASLWNRPSQNPEAAPSQPPPRLSLSRARPITTDSKTSLPVYLIAIVLAALFGATVVVLLSRGQARFGAAGSGVSGLNSASATGATGAPATVGTQDQAPDPTPQTSSMVVSGSSAQPVFNGPAGAGAATASAGVVSTTASIPVVIATATKPSTTTSKSATTPPTTTASAKPTATSILPFGKEEQ